ncbi:hypothetical protein FRC12_023338 [Ceratobasidium sp. 428]|nr:hypothetical protein FRC12_023338 [Ceratobasidium sp. 428]
MLGLHFRLLLTARSLLLIGFVASFVPPIYILTNQTVRHTYVDNPLPGILVGCIIFPAPYPWLAFVFPFVFETAVFFATVWRTRKLIQELGSAPLVNQLLRDGAFFYVAILLNVLFTCIGGIIPKIAFAAVGSGLYLAIGSVMCNRLIISLHASKRSIEWSAGVSGYTNPPSGIFRPAAAIPMTTLRTDDHIFDEHEESGVRNTISIVKG